MKQNYLLFLFLLMLINACSKQKGFSLIDSNQSNIHFNNNIIENDSFNILDFEYLYNGGGVGIGDFNNDGLEDVYFTGNMVSNALYLNKGDFVFEDITEIAKVSAKDRWSSGVAIIDINNDGWKDIYVCNTTYEDVDRRRNTLYINQGLNEDGYPYFEDLSKAYGLDDDSFSINAAFFDYDNDLDLDLIIIVNEMQDTRYPSLYRRKKKRKSNFQRIDRLYQNNYNSQKGHAYFTEVTEDAGITIPGFSLGVNITDINKDGWKDIYITNDFISNDVFYLNQKDGTFKDASKKYLKHTSHSAMGNDIVDINNDALPDIIALDMLPEGNYRQKTMLGPINYSYYLNNEKYGFTYQCARNTLQLHAGLNSDNELNKFTDVSLYSGMHATDWSWSPLIADFDQDAYRDMIITNGFPKDVTDRDYIDYHADTYAYASQEMMLSKIPSVKINNYAYRNTGEVKFEDVSEDWGITEPSYSNGAAYADFDNDGDLDYIVNNIKDKVHLYENKLKKKGNAIQLELLGSKENIDAFGATVFLEISEGNTIHYEHSPFRSYLSTQTDIIHIGVGQRDTINAIKIVWPDGKQTIRKNVKATQVLKLDYTKDAVIESGGDKEEVRPSIFISDTSNVVYQHKEDDYIDYNIQALLPHKLSQFGPAISVADINNDGLDDYYVSGAANRHGSFFYQMKEGGFRKDSFLNANPEIEEMSVLFFDAEGDGDKDMFVAAGSYEFDEGMDGNENRFYENIKGKFYYQANVIPENKSGSLALKACDYDKDGDLDLFFGGRSIFNAYPKAPSSFILTNNSINKKANFSKAANSIIDLNDVNIVTDAIWSDFDNDSWIDLIIVGEYSEVIFYKNINGSFQRIKNTGVEGNMGFWNSISSADIDNDGDQDYILGNIGNNTLNPITKEFPYRLYVNDFDKNGSVDVLPFSFQVNNEGGRTEFPVATREDFAKEINVIRKMYQTYSSYAEADIEVLITDSTMQKTDVYEVNYSETSLLINNGENSFSLKALPFQAQFAPVFASLADDFDGDGNVDILLTGNNFGNELMVGRMDGLNGLFLKGDGKGDFKTLNIKESGFYIPGDGKSLARLFTDNGDQLILSGENRGPLRIFRNNLEMILVQMEENDVYLTYEIEHSIRKKERYFGSGYLSQNSAIIPVPSVAKNILIYNSKGEPRSHNIVLE